jgi:hypothetical protein
MENFTHEVALHRAAAIIWKMFELARPADHFKELVRRRRLRRDGETSVLKRW